MKKICTGCKIEKLFAEFYNHSSSKDGLTWRCKPCLLRQAKLSYTDEDRLKHKHKMLLHYHGITIEAYNTMVLEQNNKCLGCGKEGKLNVDHCHKTGKVRGLLCSKCNVALGMVNDSIETLGRLIKYLYERKRVENEISSTVQTK